ncbi:MAG: Sun protein [Rhizobacter sp.]|nr:Sun protein [Rhizobacter sp.]
MNTLSLPLSRLIGHTADALQAVRSGRSLTDALARVDAPARPGTQALAFHVMRWLGSAQAAREFMAPKTPAPAVDAVLTTAIALMWPTGDPPLYADHTLVDQAVEAVRRRAASSGSFVNGVLRRFLRERDAVVAAAQRSPIGAWNHPPWWIDRLKQDWPSQWQAVLKSANDHPPMTLRVNARWGSGPDYVARLAESDIGALWIGGQAVVLDKARNVTALPGFAQGEVSVQDASAQIAAPLLVGHGLPGGARVLDACAAPGGKTAHLLEIADLDVLALDSDAHRLERVRETMTRLHLQCELKAADARQPSQWWDGRPFDAILLDAPCSASGIVRRHPDARWLRRPTDIATLGRIQADLLDALFPLLAPGGRLVYCTCSVFKEEGVQQIDAFLARQPAARRVMDPPSPGHLLPLLDNGGSPVGAGRTASPATAASDGFFYAMVDQQ